MTAGTVATTHDASGLLQYAQGTFQKWPEDFAGFRARVDGQDGEDLLGGEVAVFPGGRAEVELGGERSVAAWVRRALAVISRARTPRFFKDGEGRYRIAFEPQAHPLGRGVRVCLGSAGWRIYRIDAKGRIRQRESAGRATRITTNFEELMRACPGRVLPTRLHVLTWDTAARAVVETADIEIAYARYAHVWLPVRQRTSLVRGAHRRELGFELRGHVLL